MSVHPDSLCLKSRPLGICLSFRRTDDVLHLVDYRVIVRSAGTHNKRRKGIRKGTFVVRLSGLRINYDERGSDYYKSNTNTELLHEIML